jgi:hypothetical protein
MVGGFGNSGCRPKKWARAAKLPPTKTNIKGRTRDIAFTMFGRCRDKFSCGTIEPCTKAPELLGVRAIKERG